MERPDLPEGAGAVTAAELVLVLDVVHTLYVGPQVASLTELHRAEAACVRLLASVLQLVALQTLLLGESFATLLAHEGSHASVNPFVADNL